MKRRNLLKSLLGIPFFGICKTKAATVDLTPYFKLGATRGFYHHPLWSMATPKPLFYHLCNWNVAFEAYSESKEGYLKKNTLKTGTVNEEKFDTKEKRLSYIRGFLSICAKQENKNFITYSTANGKSNIDLIKKWLKEDFNYEAANFYKTEYIPMVTSITIDKKIVDEVINIE